jgi:hypothetical protein
MNLETMFIFDLVLVTVLLIVMVGALLYTAMSIDDFDMKRVGKLESQTSP